ncbi:copper amine oxidase 1, partial [Metarhizium hybridum]
MSVTHSLDSLSADEIVLASAAIRRARKSGLFFRNIFNLEPPKAQLIPHLDAEHAGSLCADTPRPPRRARAQYGVIEHDGGRSYMESTKTWLQAKRPTSDASTQNNEPHPPSTSSQSLLTMLSPAARRGGDGTSTWLGGDH